MSCAEATRSSAAEDHDVDELSVFRGLQNRPCNGAQNLLVLAARSKALRMLRCSSYAPP